jgi:hypothetical protein
MEKHITREQDSTMEDDIIGWEYGDQSEDMPETQMRYGHREGESEFFCKRCNTGFDWNPNIGAYNDREL